MNPYDFCLLLSIVDFWQRCYHGIYKKFFPSNIYFMPIKNWLNFFLPESCILCKAYSHNNLNICEPCLSELPYIKSACQRCGAILENHGVTNLQYCGNCRNRKLYFNRTIVLFEYKNPIDYLLINLKFNQKLIYARILGELFSERISAYYQDHKKPELIIPVPLHPARLRERGYNQSQELVKPIAKRLKIPVDKYSCLRVKNTLAQSLLPINERRRNISKAFLIEKPLKVKHVAIFDDILTTGNTIHELSKILYRSGVREIDVWCLAKVLMKVKHF
jgi:ComF family protein